MKEREMKRILALTVMMTANVFAMERKELMPLIEEAAGKQESAYVEVRNKVLEYGTNAVPILGEVAVDEALPWQQQLVARICYERIERKADIEKLLSSDWYRHPNFDKEWIMFRLGPEGAMRVIIEPEMKEAGLWYYYLELLWKMTGEKGRINEKNAPNVWACYCTLAVKDSSGERVWFLRVCAEILADTPPEPTPPPPRGRWINSVLVQEELPDTVPLLIQYVQMREYKGDISNFVFALSKYADSRSADALEKLVASRPKSEQHSTVR